MLTDKEEKQVHCRTILRSPCIAARCLTVLAHLVFTVVVHLALTFLAHCRERRALGKGRSAEFVPIRGRMGTAIEEVRTYNSRNNRSIETANCAKVRVHAEPMSRYSLPLYFSRTAENAEPLRREEWKDFMPMQRRVGSCGIPVKKQLMDQRFHDSSPFSRSLRKRFLSTRKII